MDRPICLVSPSLDSKRLDKATVVGVSGDHGGSLVPRYRCEELPGALLPWSVEWSHGDRQDTRRESGCSEVRYRRDWSVPEQSGGMRSTGHRWPLVMAVPLFAVVSTWRALRMML